MPLEQDFQDEEENCSTTTPVTPFRFDFSDPMREQDTILKLSDHSVFSAKKFLWNGWDNKETANPEPRGRTKNRNSPEDLFGTFNNTASFQNNSSSFQNTFKNTTSLHPQNNNFIIDVSCTTSFRAPGQQEMHGTLISDLYI